jgi:signal transduction histidine kinase
VDGEHLAARRDTGGGHGRDLPGRVTDQHASGMQSADAQPQERFPLGRRELLLIFAFWTFFALLTAANRMLDPRSPSPVFSAPALELALLESYLWALLTPFVFWLGARFGEGQGSRVPRVLLLIAVGLVIALFVDLTVEVARRHLYPPPRRRVITIWTITRLRYLNDVMVYLAVLAAGVARDYFRRYRARQQEAVRREAHAAQLQAQLAEARLSVLRTQLNPHFLFNTLHAVSTLVERDPKGVRRMIARLSELLRFTLDGSAEQEIPLHEELELLRRYLEIMQIRFQGRLETTLDASPEVQDALVPNLVLQPLVENALKHGVSKTEGVGRIIVRAERRGDELVLTVRDNGHAAGAGDASVQRDEAAGSGVGLRNTRARLEQHYGRHQRLTLQPAADGGVVAEIVLPFHTRSEPRAVAVPAGD